MPRQHVFKVGDPVRLSHGSNIGDHATQPDLGRVVEIGPSLILIAFEGWTGGHGGYGDLSGAHDASTNLWWCWPHDLVPAPAQLSLAF